MDTQDYRKSPEGRENARKYADIIHASRPASQRPPMDLVQRAKIFTPYDALRGFDEAIDQVDETVTYVAREELSEEQKAILSDQLLQVRKGMHLTARYFIPEVSNNKGRYADITGTVLRIDPIVRTLSLEEDSSSSDRTNGKSGEHPLEKSIPTVISFDDLLTLSSPSFRDIDDFLGTDIPSGS